MKEAQAQDAMAVNKPDVMEDVDPLPIIHKWQLAFKKQAVQIEDELQGNVPVEYLVWLTITSVIRKSKLTCTSSCKQFPGNKHYSSWGPGADNPARCDHTLCLRVDVLRFSNASFTEQMLQCCLARINAVCFGSPSEAAVLCKPHNALHLVLTAIALALQD